MPTDRRLPDVDQEDLEPIEPREAMDLWLERQATEKAEETLQSYRYRLEPFVEWCEENGVGNLNEIDGRTVLRFESELRDRERKKTTLNNQLGTLRLWLEWCVTIEAVTPDVPLKVDVPELSKGDSVRYSKLPPRRAAEILTNLRRYEYSSRDHAIFELAWHTAARLGALHSLDVEDLYLEERDLRRLRHEADLSEKSIEEAEPPFVFFRHRPGQDTTLKNDTDGERPVAISEHVAEVLDEYVAVNRIEQTDDHNRRPLFTTQHGRMSKGSIRRHVYQITQPCHYGTCPHDREPDDCEALEHGFEARCPSSREPHALRSGSIVHHRDQGWHPAEVSERVDAGVDVIEAHYDHEESLRRMASRRTNVEQLEDD